MRNSARTKEGRAVAKNMSKVYSEMLTKELVKLRAEHQRFIDECSFDNNRKVKALVATRRDLVAQINIELADRVANFNLFV